LALAGTTYVCLTLTGCQDGPLDPIVLAPTALQDGLVAHYTFDEGMGTMVLDSSGQNHDGVNMGGTWITSGKFLGAMHFDGVSTVTVSNFPYVRPTDPGLSVSYWIRAPAVDAGMDAGSYETILSTEFFRVGGWEMNLDETSPLGIQTSYWDPDAGSYTSIECACLTADTWTHVVSVFDAVAHTLSLYVNATLTKTIPMAAPIAHGTLQLQMGHWFGPPIRFLVGDLDDVAIYSRPLSPAEVAALKQHPAP
jgi:hypothetical protein